MTSTTEEICDLKTLMYTKSEVYNKTEDSSNFEEWIESWLSEHVNYSNDGVLLISY